MSKDGGPISRSKHDGDCSQGRRSDKTELPHCYHGYFKDIGQIHLLDFVIAFR